MSLARNHPHSRSSSNPVLAWRHTNTLYQELAGAVGAPNRWITLRALRVLDWYGA